MPEIDELVATLRAHRGDTAAVEVKRGSGGYPTSVLESLCALANLPGGGTVIIGLDEAAGFAPATIVNSKDYMKAVGGQARALEPPAVVDVEPVEFEGRGAAGTRDACARNG